jgi:hypothetical protein
MQKNRVLLAIGAGLIAGCLILSVAGVLGAGWALFSSPMRERLPTLQALLRPDHQAPAVAGATPSPAAAALTPSVQAPVVLASRELKEESKDPKYMIDASWPYIEQAGEQPFNSAVETLVQREISSFKDGVSSIPDDPTLDDFSSSLNISYTPTLVNHDLLSVLIKVSFYNAGAAHPGSYFYSINYDLRQEKEISLGDLFRSDASYLETISAYCLDDLRSRDVLAWEDGALPLEENYQVWNITPDGLKVTFNEYQVAPYAAGPQSVTVPYPVLEELIQPGSPINTIRQNED